MKQMPTKPNDLHWYTCLCSFFPLFLPCFDVFSFVSLVFSSIIPSFLPLCLILLLPPFPKPHFFMKTVNQKNHEEIWRSQLNADFFGRSDRALRLRASSRLRLMIGRLPLFHLSVPQRPSASVSVPVRFLRSELRIHWILKALSYLALTSAT